MLGSGPAVAAGACGAGLRGAGHPSVLDLIETVEQKAENREQQNRDGDHWRHTSWPTTPRECPGANSPTGESCEGPVTATRTGAAWPTSTVTSLGPRHIS
ncbi:hypothetical protein K376_02067 [Streptomyces sp. PsTaAH-130]|nr:hypothetical protein K376_02067 [Streptomyces sp. PsTaAH-130]